MIGLRGSGCFLGYDRGLELLSVIRSRSLAAFPEVRASGFSDKIEMWNIVLYNVLSLVSTGRCNEIALTCKADIVICPGTRLRSPQGRRHWKEQLDGGYWAMHFGWQRQPFTNKSAGVSFIFGPKIPELNVVKVESSPIEIAGRCGAVRIKNRTADMCFVAAYPPPYT